MATARTAVRQFAATAAIAAAAITAPAAASASGLPSAPLPADVDIRVEATTIRATIAVHGAAGASGVGTLVCSGPWVHTEASANRILSSPDIDLATEPAYWTMYQPDSPNAGMTGTGTPALNRLYLTEGQSGEAVIPAVADGRYVAGVVCGQFENVGGWTVPKYTSLMLYPLTVGAPDGTVSPPESGGSLGAPFFGSS